MWWLYSTTPCHIDNKHYDQNVEFVSQCKHEGHCPVVPIVDTNKKVKLDYTLKTGGTQRPKYANISSIEQNVKEVHI